MYFDAPREWLRRLVIDCWVGWLPDLLPWPLRVRVWNWMWDLPLREQIDPVTRMRRGRGLLGLN